VWPRKSSKKADKKAAKKASQPVGETPAPAPVAPARAYQRPRADFLTVLLVIALLALLLGILFLCLEMNYYDFKFKGGPTPPVGMLGERGPAGAGRAVVGSPRLVLASLVAGNSVFP
jgi:hypothetical protein